MELEGSVAAGTADGKYLALGPVRILSWMLKQLKHISEEGIVLRSPAPCWEGFFPGHFSPFGTVIMSVMLYFNYIPIMKWNTFIRQVAGSNPAGPIK